jgi:hypothetical protein
MARTVAPRATARPSSRPLELIGEPQQLIDNPSRLTKLLCSSTPAIVTPLSMPIVRASSGGLAHVIFNLPSRITIRGHIDPFCRDATLKMLCPMLKCPPRKVPLRACRSAGSLIAMADKKNSGPQPRPPSARCSPQQKSFAVGPLSLAPCSPRQGPAVNGRRRPPLTRLRAVLIGTGQQRSQ